MSIFTAAMTFVIVWWLVLFMVLPFGAAPPDEIEPGHARSAPARPRMLLKILITTVLAAGLTVAVNWFLESDLINVRDDQNEVIPNQPANDHFNIVRLSQRHDPDARC